MTTNQEPRPITADADRRAAIITDRYAALKFIPNNFPADRSRNGRRIPRSVKHKGLR